MAKKYALGLDYGTQSGRAVLVEVETGSEAAAAVREYAHGVMDETLPDGTPLPQDWALQPPQDYLTVLEETVREVMQVSGVSADDVIGIGVDFTTCTTLPVDAAAQHKLRLMGHGGVDKLLDILIEGDDSQFTFFRRGYHLRLPVLVDYVVYPALGIIKSAAVDKYKVAVLTAYGHLAVVDRPGSKGYAAASP